MEYTMNEIIKANQYIDAKLEEMNAENRAAKSLEIVLAVRNLNDNIALTLYNELFPGKPMGVNKAGAQFMSNKELRFISKFHKFLNESVSHFTPSEDGAERLMIKYYDYLVQLKNLMYKRYGIKILSNINNFWSDLDEQTDEYYTKVSEKIINLGSNLKPSSKDVYYIYKCKPFVVNRKILYEVTLEKASDKTNKFNRITAFTHCNIDTNYATELEIINSSINMFGIELPILIINNWNISIRPCELINFSKVLEIDLKMQRSYSEYRVLMKFLKDECLNLVDIVTLCDEEFNIIKNKLELKLKSHTSQFFKILKKCQTIITENRTGQNILKYLLIRMNNKVIKDQWPKNSGKRFKELYLSAGCFPFETHPYSFDPLGHIANYYDLLYCFGIEGRISDILARFVNNNTHNNCKLYTSFDELSMFGNKDNILSLIVEYNKSLNKVFKPRCMIEVYKDYVYKYEYEDMTKKVMNLLLEISIEKSDFYHLFEKEKIEVLKTLDDDNKLDDSIKEDILTGMYNQSKVHLIYGPAGTGKTKLVNYISYLMIGYRKVFLAKTNAAVMNLSYKVKYCENDDYFLTIDKYLKQGYKDESFDMIVVDECSTVKNEEILEILNTLGNAILVLVGDVFQIEAIGYGNWFNIVRDIIPKYCCHELKNPYRTEDKNLIKLWDAVRNMDEDNVVLEKIVRDDYSVSLDKQIFNNFSNDEIILCLNYSGLYGLNNINRLMQLSNPNPSISIGILQYKINDPILFNDSNRFPDLYNNLKGKIINIDEKDDFVIFEIEVPLKFNVAFGRISDGLILKSQSNNSSVISFIVKKSTPYSSDTDDLPKEYIMPFQVAYAVSIHKSQGLEYESVKIVIADDSENMINHNIFYTAITRTRKKLTIYWSPEVCNRILNKIRPKKEQKDYNILKSKMGLQ